MTHRTLTAKPFVSTSRRKLLQAGAATGALSVLGTPSLVHAQSTPKIRIGYWPIAAGLPFYAALEKGYFKEAGLDVEGVKFASAAQIMEAMTVAPTVPAQPTWASVKLPPPVPLKSLRPTQVMSKTCWTNF